MKKALLWTAVTAGAGVGAMFVFRWIQRARVGLAHGLEQAERVTAATRQSLEETERALSQARGTIS
ncbi:MAG TPA: hypothetical protein VK911_17315 [Vicinamibacterales bacterium]|nr:hypothetical protein [Vicinamibacterales bacterium]